ncbi:hypothetical protein TSUD_193290 [Trifolium subterraneum]|uniref:Uncharacterized protein n=1 Tax=Trifolium subterraneum TaxID=3900 RepID=A0A2Z6LRD7_TRISU|nr:hypothetical protein TSUD_193290 [Trifolium subterraneum]
MGSASHGSFRWTWNSSVSFLYGGLAPIFIVIGIALLTVACSRCLRPEIDQLPMTSTDSNKSGRETNTEIDREPNILVYTVKLFLHTNMYEYCSSNLRSKCPNNRSNTIQHNCKEK